MMYISDYDAKRYDRIILTIFVEALIINKFKNYVILIRITM